MGGHRVGVFNKGEMSRAGDQRERGAGKLLCHLPLKRGRAKRIITARQHKRRHVEARQAAALVTPLPHHRLLGAMAFRVDVARHRFN